MKNAKFIFGMLLAGTTVLVSCGDSTPTKEDNKVILPLVKIDTAKIEVFEHKIIVQGNVTTDQDVIINSESGGLITKIHVNEGQRVSKGQVLVSIDASILNANLNELETNLEYAEYMLGKQEELKKRGVGSEFELEQAKNQVNSIKSSMRSLNTQRGKAQIRAPFSGTIDKIFAKDGQMTGPQASVLRLVNASTIDITADISDKHLVNVQLGTPVSISFPNFRDTVIEQQITYVGNYIEPTNRTVRIMTTIKNNKTLLPNMLAELHITDLKEDSALVIDSKAVLKTQENMDYVFVAEPATDGNYKIRQVEVTVVSKFNGKSFIRSSELKAGDIVIKQGGNNLAEGEIVRTK